MFIRFPRASPKFVFLAVLGVFAFVESPPAQERLRAGKDGYFEGASITRTLAFTHSSRFSVRVPDVFHGELEVRVEKRADVRIRVVLGLKSDNARAARRFLESSDVNVSMSDRGSTLDLELGDAESYENERVARAIVTIDAPVGCSLIIEAPTLDTRVDGPASYIRLDAPRAATELSGVRGMIKIDDATADVAIQDLTGEFDIFAQAGEVTLRDIVIQDPAGGVAVARIEIENGAIALDDFEGHVNISLQAGAIQADNVSLRGVSEFSTTDGSVEIGISRLAAEAAVRCETQSAPLFVTVEQDVSARVIARVDREGAVEIDNITHTFEEIDARSFVARLGAGAATISVKSKYGNVTLRGR